MRTQALNQIGVGRKKPITHYLEKYYPIENRKDFYKWVIVTPRGQAKDYKGDIMYFDAFNLDQAKNTLKAIKKVLRENADWYGNRF